MHTVFELAARMRENNKDPMHKALMRHYNGRNDKLLDAEARPWQFRAGFIGQLDMSEDDQRDLLAQLLTLYTHANDAFVARHNAKDSLRALHWLYERDAWQAGIFAMAGLVDPHERRMEARV